MDEAFVEDSEHHVDNDHRENQQQAHAAQGRLERSRHTLECRVDAGWKVASHILDFLDGLAQRRSRLEVEGDGDGRQLPEMVYRERSNRVARLRYGVQWNQLPAG